MLHDIFKEAAKLVPNKAALQFESDAPISYSELDGLSNEMALSLLSQGVKPNTVVAIYLPRSIEQVVAFLAILKLGCVYLPLSPQAARPYLESLLTQSKAGFLITHSALAPLDVSVSSFQIDRQSTAPQLSRAADGGADELPEISQNADSLAYMIGSSGSTGAPKLIPIRHLGFEYWRVTLKNTIEGPEPDNILANTSVSFDPHIWEYLMAWTFGATLHLTSDATRQDVRELARFMSSHNITDATLTPPTIRQLMSTSFFDRFNPGQGKMLSLYSTGEACTPDIISALPRAVDLYNCYGPTEATFGLSMIKVSADDFFEDLAPIKLPTDSEVSIRIVDEEEKEVEEGQSGRLVIISNHLSPGYIQCHPEDQHRFTKLSVDGIEKNAYITDDLFFSQGGKLYYQGRISDLAIVKIRAQKVDPRATESILRQHNDIEDVCVIVKKNSANQQHLLVAYLVARDAEKRPTIRMLRAHLAKTLTNAFIPSYFEFLPSLPITNNGKIDRRDLAARPVTFQRDADSAYIAPRTALEKQLLSVWNQALGSNTESFPIGIEDTFTELGGDSLQIMTLVSLLEEELDIRIPLSELGVLEKLTVAKAAEFIYLQYCEQKKINTAKLIKTGENSAPAFFLIHPITGEGAASYRELGTHLDINRNIYAIDAPMLTHPTIGSCSIEAIAKSYVRMAREKQPHGPYYLLGWSSGSWIAYQMAYELEKQGETEVHLLLIDEPAPQVLQNTSDVMFAEQLAQLREHLLTSPASATQDQVPPQVENKRRQVINLFTELEEKNPSIAFSKIILHASLTYTPPDLRNTDIALFVASETLSTIKNTIRATPGADAEEVPPMYHATIGWSNYADSIRITELDGNHFSILKTGAEKLAQIIAGIVQRNTPPRSISNEAETLSQRVSEMYNLLMLALGNQSTQQPFFNSTNNSFSLFANSNRLKADEDSLDVFKESESSRDSELDISDSPESVAFGADGLSFDRKSALKPLKEGLGQNARSSSTPPRIGNSTSSS